VHIVVSMRANTKGSLHEREAVAEYEHMGWIVFKPQKTSMFGTQDIFNMFDFCAVKDNELHFVQVKTANTRGFLKKLQEWREAHQVPGVEWRLWVRLDARRHPEKWRKY